MTTSSGSFSYSAHRFDLSDGDEADFVATTAAPCARGGWPRAWPISPFYCGGFVLQAGRGVTEFPSARSIFDIDKGLGTAIGYCA
jgi:hypothetical protein